MMDERRTIVKHLLGLFGLAHFALSSLSFYAWRLSYYTHQKPIRALWQRTLVGCEPLPPYFYLACVILYLLIGALCVFGGQRARRTPDRVMAVLLMLGAALVLYAAGIERYTLIWSVGILVFSILFLVAPDSLMQ